MPIRINNQATEMEWSAKYSRPQCIAADQVPGLVNTAIQRQASISSQRLCGSKIIEEDVSNSPWKIVISVPVLRTYTGCRA